MLSETRAEELVREALTAQADRAPAATDILAALHGPDTARHGRVPRGRVRRDHLVVGAAIGALVVLAVITVPLGFSVFHSATAVPGGVGQEVPVVPRGYRPTWLPPGFVAVAQSDALTTGDNGSGETWWPAADAARADAGHVPHSKVYVATWQIQRNEPVEGQSGRHQDVDVNGMPGVYSANGGTAEVDFSPVWNVRVSVVVTNVPDAKNVVLRMARSVVNETSTMDVPVRYSGQQVVLPSPRSGVSGVPVVPPRFSSTVTFSSVPPVSVTGLPYPQGSEQGRLFVQGSSPQHWTARLQRPLGADPGQYLDIEWGPDLRPLRDPGTVGKPVTVLGRRGWYLDRAAQQAVFGSRPDRPVFAAEILVRIDGRWLVVGSPVDDEATAVALADGVTVYPSAAFDWLGRS